MQKFTYIEIKWVCGLLEQTSRELLVKAKAAEETSDIAPQMLQLKAEQYADISKRLREALEKENKRIEITYYRGRRDA